MQKVWITLNVKKYAADNAKCLDVVQGVMERLSLQNATVVSMKIKVSVGALEVNTLISLYQRSLVIILIYARRLNMYRQMTIFDFIGSDKPKKVHHDCEGCDCERYGLECMEKRGFIWNRYRGDYFFVDGVFQQLPIEQRECKKESYGLRD